MNLEMLRNYDNWIGKSPAVILKAVKETPGGWAKVFDKAVFPKGLPEWAHRVRNYFNREPRFLTRLSKERSQFLLVQSHRGAVDYYGTKDKIVRSFTLSDDVYSDEYGEAWFQMSPGGTIYHFKEVGQPTVEAGQQTLNGQWMTPIFKLVSPDGTGGSCETILDNPLRIRHEYGVSFPSRGSTITEVNVTVSVGNLIETNPRYQGSYNYAETVVQGINNHDKFDVKPHTNKSYGTYVNPPNRFEALGFRKFPKLNGGG